MRPAFLCIENLFVMMVVITMFNNSRFQFDDANKIHEPHHIKSWIQFKPFTGKIWILAIFMVIVLKEFSQ